MKSASLFSIIFVGLTTLALTVFAKQIVLPEELKLAQIHADKFLMQEPFSSEPLQFYSSLEAAHYN